jgi:hypothetical protein
METRANTPFCFPMHAQAGLRVAQIAQTGILNVNGRGVVNDANDALRGAIYLRIPFLLYEVFVA